MRVYIFYFALIMILIIPENASCAETVGDLSGSGRVGFGIFLLVLAGVCLLVFAFGGGSHGAGMMAIILGIVGGAIIINGLDLKNSEDKAESYAKQKKLGEVLKMLNSNKGPNRLAASKFLGNFKDDDAIDSLLMTMNDNDKYIRTEAELSLEIIGEYAIDRLIKNLNNIDPSMRKNSAIILANYKFPVVKKALQENIFDEERIVRISIANALRKYTDDKYKLIQNNKNILAKSQSLFRSINFIISQKYVDAEEYKGIDLSSKLPEIFNFYGVVSSTKKKDHTATLNLNIIGVPILAHYRRGTKSASAYTGATVKVTALLKANNRVLESWEFEKTIEPSKNYRLKFFDSPGPEDAPFSVAFPNDEFYTFLINGLNNIFKDHLNIKEILYNMIIFGEDNLQIVADELYQKRKNDGS